MTDENEIQEAKINKNLETLRQVFEPLTAGLTADVEPAVIYFPQPTIPGSKTSHDG
ncbi:MAG: hypothetical protein ACJ73N_10635 [Bryobacteraceae bacterium]|jgi:hypothetical protein